MAINVIMKRTPKSGAVGILNSVLQELRQLATSQPGYISGETFYSAFNLQHWQEYEICTERQGLIDRLAELLDEPAVTEVYLPTK